jgi:formate C-acetyltransferase
LSFNQGDAQPFLRGVQTGEIARDCCGQSIMSPLPLTSGLFHGCIENATDLTRLGNLLPHKGAMVMAPVVAINSLAAIKKCVFEQKTYTLAEIKKACAKNFEGFEKMRQTLWNCPKWGNDDDYADLIGKEIIEAACGQISRHKTPRGGVHLSGIHQPHPVPTGAGTPATPEGRFAGAPVPVTLSPENGTMKNGPTAAFLSALKIDPKYIQWNNCLMLQYFSSSFDTAQGAKSFERLVGGYFGAGGSQHQPNIASLEDLKLARNEPEKYRDLTVRLWGVSARFVTLSREMQDEFIARFEGI